MKVNALHEKVEFDNIRHMVETIGEKFDGKVAYRYRVKPHDKEAVKVNYEVLRDNVRALSSKMLAESLGGKKVVLIGKHTYQWIVSYYATMSIGSVLVPLDRDWAKEDLLETVRTAEADFIFCDKDIEE